MSVLEQFKEQIEQFLSDAEMDATAFGRDALNDGNFVRDMRDGIRSPTTKTIDKVIAFMREYRERAAV